MSLFTCCKCLSENRFNQFYQKDILSLKNIFIKFIKYLEFNQCKANSKEIDSVVFPKFYKRSHTNPLFSSIYELIFQRLNTCNQANGLLRTRRFNRLIFQVRSRFDTVVVVLCNQCLLVQRIAEFLECKLCLTNS
jgi:hypothetical protein